MSVLLSIKLEMQPKSLSIGSGVNSTLGSGKSSSDSASSFIRHTRLLMSSFPLFINPWAFLNDVSRAFDSSAPAVQRGRGVR